MINIRFLLSMMSALLPAFVFAQNVARSFVVEWPYENDTARVHVFLPPSNLATGRAILDCPGGGYSHLSMLNEGTDWAEFFCKKGIAFAVLQYRMPKGNRDVPISDAERAMKMLRDSAQLWHVNPYDVGIMGFSAGGHLASTVSTHAEWEARPDFSILFYPVITMGKRGQHEGSCKNFLGKDRDNDAVAKTYSNELQVRRHLTPPSIILLANDDTGVPPVPNGVAYYSAMRNAGNDCTMHIYPHGGHGFGYGERKPFSFRQQMLDDLTAWLDGLKMPAKGSIRVACIGNSITDGSGIDMAETKGYPAQLQKLLGGGYNVRNFGVGARTLLNSGDRPFMKELAWRDALAFNPDVVIIKLGTNDSKTDNWKHKDDFVKDYQSMIDQLRSLPAHPRIILANPIKAFKDQWTITDSVITREVIPEIEKVAKANGLEVLDLHSVITDASMIISDGIHPNSQGAGKIAQAVAEIIKTNPPVDIQSKKRKSSKKTNKTK